MNEQSTDTSDIEHTRHRRIQNNDRTIYYGSL